MNPQLIRQKLSLLQERLEQHRGRPEITGMLEETYWTEVDRLRKLGAYEYLPTYVGWLSSYRRGPPREYRGAD